MTRLQIFPILFEDFTDGVADGWSVFSGDWSVSNDKYIGITLPGDVSGTEYPGVYSNFVFETRGRKVNADDSFGFFFNGDPSTPSNAYSVLYANTYLVLYSYYQGGVFKLSKMVNDSFVELFIIGAKWRNPNS